MPPRSNPRRLVAAAALLAVALVPITAAPADAAVKTYSSCAAVHKMYSGGIAKAGVTRNTVHHRDGSVTRTALKGKVRHSTASYTANGRLDADRDGVACEKS